jgi:hypothetical protein
MAEHFESINKNGKLLDVVFTIDKTFRDGRTFPQFRFKDLIVKEKIQE